MLLRLFMPDVTLIREEGEDIRRDFLFQVLLPEGPARFLFSLEISLAVSRKITTTG